MGHIIQFLEGKKEQEEMLDAMRFYREEFGVD